MVVALSVFRVPHSFFSRASSFSMSISSLSSRPFALLLAGVLLVPATALAQTAVPSIVPTDETAILPSTSAITPLSPTPALGRMPIAAPASVPKGQQMIESFTFRDIEATELLSMISGTFNVPIAISGDASGKVSYVNASNITPNQAIKLVTQIARLQCQQNADGTYIIGKNIAPDVPAQAIVPSQSNPSLFAPPALANTGISPSTRGVNDGSGVLPSWGHSDPEPALVTPTGAEELAVVSDPTADETRKTYHFRIRNVKSSMMAYWLDPADNPEPIELRAARALEKNYTSRGIKTQTIGGNSLSEGSNTIAAVGGIPHASNNPYINQDGVETRSNAQFGGQFGGNQGGNQGRGGVNGRGGVGGRGGGVFQLPTGVDQIVAVDAQNVLLVRGTQAGIAELRDTIAFLDRPLRQVEIEAQFLSVATADVAQFGIDFTTARGNFNASATGLQPQGGNGALQIGFVRGNFQAALTALQNSNRAKTLSAPRVTAINNYQASLSQDVYTPIRLNTTQSVVGGNTAATNTNTSVTYVTTTISLDVTPTINNDGTVTVLLNPQFESTGTPDAATGASTITNQSLQTIANVRDGETIALGGLKTKSITISNTRVPVLSYIPFIGNLFKSNNKSESEAELIIFLTARILHRVGDEAP